MTRRADPYDWSGGHPALDFVNTLDERPSDAPIENLATYDALVRFAGLAGLIEPSASKRFQPLKGAAGTRIARRARELREHLYAILAANYARQPVPQGSLDSYRLGSPSCSRSASVHPSGSVEGGQTPLAVTNFSGSSIACLCAGGRKPARHCRSRGEFESAEPPIARSTSSTRARRTDGSGAACRTAATAKNKGAGARKLTERHSVFAR